MASCNASRGVTATRKWSLRSRITGTRITGSRMRGNRMRGNRMTGMVRRSQPQATDTRGASKFSWSGATLLECRHLTTKCEDVGGSRDVCLSCPEPRSTRPTFCRTPLEAPCSARLRGTCGGTRPERSSEGLHWVSVSRETSRIRSSTGLVVWKTRTSSPRVCSPSRGSG